MVNYNIVRKPESPGIDNIPRSSNGITTCPVRDNKITLTSCEYSKICNNSINRPGDGHAIVYFLLESELCFFSHRIPTFSKTLQIFVLVDQTIKRGLTFFFD